MTYPKDRRDELGFVDEGLHFAVSDDEVKPSSVPSDAEVWGELFIDRTGGANFKFHVEKGIGFERARRCLERFVSIIQQRIDTAEKCPYYEPKQKTHIPSKCDDLNCSICAQIIHLTKDA